MAGVVALDGFAFGLEDVVLCSTSAVNTEVRWGSQSPLAFVREVLAFGDLDPRHALVLRLPY